MYDVASGCCAACLRHKHTKRLPNRIKAVNHWASDGSGKEKSGTISNCMHSHEVPGLVEWARLQNDIKKQTREIRIHIKQIQAIRDSADSPGNSMAVAQDARPAVTMVPPGLLTKSASMSSGKWPKSASENVKQRLAHTASYVEKLEAAIAQHVVEDAPALAVTLKAAFRGVVDTAIEFGANIGCGVFKHPGRKRMRDNIIPAAVDKIDQCTELTQFDAKIENFGATLASDGKDDVSKDHLINYVTVTPDGYRWENCSNVSGISRKSEWVSEDLLNKVAALEGKRIGVSAEDQEEEEDVCPPLLGCLEDILDELHQEDAEAADRSESLCAQHMVNAFLALEACDIQSEGATATLNAYVQVVTDTPSVNAKAWRLIEEASPHLLANPCVFHCINLHFKHLMKGDKTDRKDPREPIAEFVDADEWTKELEQFWTNKETPRVVLVWSQLFP